MANIAQQLLCGQNGVFMQGEVIRNVPKGVLADWQARGHVKQGPAVPPPPKPTAPAAEEEELFQPEEEEPTHDNDGLPTRKQQRGSSK